MKLSTDILFVTYGNSSEKNVYLINSMDVECYANVITHNEHQL